MHRIFYFPETDDPLEAGARALCYSNFHGCFFAQAGDIDRAAQHLGTGGDHATVFHLTADEHIFHRAADAKAARERCQRFINKLEAFVGAGGRFVWSIETAAPLAPFADDQATSWRIALGALAHLIHCPTFATAFTLQAALDVDARKFIVLPPGSYRPLIDRRPQGPPPTPLRDKLDLAIDACLFAHLGRPGHSASTERLLDCWRANVPDDRALILLDQSDDTAGRRDIAALKEDRVYVAPKASSIATLAAQLAAADLLVLPVDHPVGCNAIMAALSCGRPLLLPAFPAFLELVTPGREALVYDPDGGEAAFAEALEAALRLERHQLQAMGALAAQRADTLPWRQLGRQLADGFLRAVAGAQRVIPALEPALPAKTATTPRLVS